MEYLKAKSDLEFIKRFRDDVIELGRMEDKASEELHNYNSTRLVIPSEYQKAIQHIATEHVDNYQDVREKVAKGVHRAVRLGYKHGISSDVQSAPPRTVGGVIIPQNIIMATITDNSYGGIERQLILDTVNMIIGACEAHVQAEWGRLKNPLNWLKEGLKFILRIPFMIFEASGFNVGKVEEHLFAKLFKVVEVILIIYILLRLGLGRDGLIEILKGVFGK